ncbi:MAG: methyltransferase [Alphaproteobacteria bacterium]|nr:methyltransferase [Alphaproteobacteria bacterium]
MSHFQDFIRAHTQLMPIDFLPEITLHVAQKMEPLWKEMESSFGDPDCEPPFWAFAWAGGLGLSRHIMDHPELVKGKRVLDFAAGSGLVGIAAARAGAKKVWSCDIDPLSQAAIKMNADSNDVQLAPMKISYLKEPVRGIDVILAGDVCYDHLMAHRVVAWLRLCVRHGITVIMGDPGRAYVPRERIEVLATMTVPTSLALEDMAQREVQVLSLLG